MLNTELRTLNYVLNVVCGASSAIYINCPRQLALQCCERKWWKGVIGTSLSNKIKKKIVKYLSSGGVSS